MVPTPTRCPVYAWCIWAVILLSCRTAIAEPQAPIAAKGCVEGTNYETDGYRITGVRVHHPFAFLRRIRGLKLTADELAKPLLNAPFRYADVWRIRDELDKLAWLPDDSGQRIHISLIIVAVENCDAGELDVVYSIYSSQIAAVPSFTWESRKAETATPQTTAGADRSAGKLQFKPILQYNKTEQAGAGIQAGYALPAGSAAFVRSISAGALKSRHGHDIHVSSEGSMDHQGGRLAQTRWDLDYSNSSTPVFGANLERSGATARLSTTTPPALGVMPLRFGASLKAGKHRLTPSAREAPGENTSYRSVKLFGGVAARTRRNVLSGSYGLELGMSDGYGIDWRKQVVDIGHELSWPAQDHRALEVESRFTAGMLSVLGRIPAGTRFFGGNKEEFFTTGDDWQIRSNPYIRSVPANDFAGNDRGADRFAAYNLTVAYPIWNYPLIPAELTGNDEFTMLLDGQLVTATSILQTDYLARDPHFKRAAEMLPEVLTALSELGSAVDAARASGSRAEGDPLLPLFDACTAAIDIAERRTRAASDNEGAEQYARVVALIPEDEDRLNGALAACMSGLNSKLNNPDVAQSGAALMTIAAALIGEFGQIDDNKAAAQAEAEMSYAKRTLNTLLYDINIFELKPAAMFDAARLSESSAGTKLTRYGIGGGLRLTLVSHVSFTVGYLINPARQPNDARGALAFSLQYRDLFD